MIHEKGTRLAKSEKKRMESSGRTQERAIAILFRSKPGESMTFYDVVQITGFHRDSVKRALSNMSGSARAPEKYKDLDGNYPLIKTKQKRTNPESGVKIHLFTWNHRYKSKAKKVKY